MNVQYLIFTFSCYPLPVTQVEVEACLEPGIEARTSLSGVPYLYRTYNNKVKLGVCQGREGTVFVQYVQ